MAGMISSGYDGSVFPSCIDARCRYERGDSDFLFNTANANFRASGPLPESLTQRRGAGKPGTNSHRHDTNCRVAGMGFGRPKNCGQHERRYYGDLALHLLRHLPLLSVCALGRIFRSAFVRSVLLFVVPAKHSLSWQARHFRPRQGCVFPVRGVPLEATKNSVALWHVTDEYSSGSDPWLIAHFDSSSMRWNKRAN
jgi:hypothetical protein